MKKLIKKNKGVVLVAVIALVVILTLLGFAMLNLAGSETTLSIKDVNRTKAFYLAESGLAMLPQRLRKRNYDNLGEISLGDGSFKVDVFYDEDPPYAVSTGRSDTEVKRIKVQLTFLARPYEEAIYAGNTTGSDFVFELRGEGDPYNSWVNGKTRHIGGRDKINGNVYVDGDVSMSEESSVNPSPSPNPYGLNGDVEATGDIDNEDSSTISGDVTPDAESLDNPDLLAMNYRTNNTHNVGQIFSDNGVSSGHLPSGHELANFITKNPSNRSSECNGTVGDDYFLEPRSVSNNSASSTDARTQLDIGNENVYYIDGNVWIHSKSTYGFLLEGNATIVATGDIYICDNTKYADSDSLLGLVALGNYDNDGDLQSGGNIYFGDPRYGTTYTVSGLMFAANDFLYNTDSVSGESKEPETGFKVFGNYAAMNKVSVNRDWYQDSSTGKARPAYFDKATNQWKDVENGSVLSSSEFNSLRHYQMEITYDDRLRNPDTQPPGLPKAKKGTIYGGMSKWQEI